MLPFSNKEKLWETVGKTAHTALKLKDKIPQLKKDIGDAQSFIQKSPKTALVGGAVAGYSKSKLPYAGKVASLIDMIQQQKVTPWEGVSIGKYNARGPASYNRQIGGLEYDKVPAYGINITKRF